MAAGSAASAASIGDDAAAAERAPGARAEDGPAPGFGGGVTGLRRRSTAEPVISLDDLEVRLGGRPILHGLTVQLEGRALGLLGPNGAGKTTLIHTLLGFHRPSRGTARILGRDIQSRRQAREIRARVGYMPERDAFVHDMSAVRFVRMTGELSGLPPASALERAHEALIAVGLGEARYRDVGTYSLGMKQRVKLAQAIVHGPQLLFLDEPTNGLDPAARSRMIRLIRDIRQSGVTIVLSSHLLRDVEATCEDVLILRDGRIAVHADLAAERRTNLRFLDLEVRGDAVAFAAALSGRGWEVAAAGTRRLKAIMPAVAEMNGLFELAAQHGVQIRRLDNRRDSLADIFLRAMGVPMAPPGASSHDPMLGSPAQADGPGLEVPIGGPTDAARDGDPHRVGDGVPADAEDRNGGGYPGSSTQ